MKESEAESKSMHSKLSEATESCTNLKNLLEATQQVRAVGTIEQNSPHWY